MSIEVTRFSFAQGSDLDTIKSWFDTNATEYFTSSEISENKLLLKRGTDTLIEFDRDDYFSINLHVNSSNTVRVFSYSADYISRIAKTPNGIAVGFADDGYGGRDYAYGLLISKTSENNIGVVANTTMGEYTTNAAYYFQSLGGSLRSVATAFQATIMYDSVTTLTPVICEGADGEYMPNCFITTFSQYGGVDCTFTADGTEYLYSGFIAMR